MSTKNLHRHEIRWALAFLALVIITLILLIAGPAAQDQGPPDASAPGDAIQGTQEAVE